MKAIFATLSHTTRQALFRWKTSLARSQMIWCTCNLSDARWHIVPFLPNVRHSNHEAMTRYTCTTKEEAFSLCSVEKKLFARNMCTRKSEFLQDCNYLGLSVTYANAKKTSTHTVPLKSQVTALATLEMLRNITTPCGIPQFQPRTSMRLPTCPRLRVPLVLNKKVRKSMMMTVI